MSESFEAFAVRSPASLAPLDRVGWLAEQEDDFRAFVLREARGHLKRGGILVVEVGGERATVDKQFKDVPMTWLTTSAGDDMVFLTRQEEMT